MLWSCGNLGFNSIMRRKKYHLWTTDLNHHLPNFAMVSQKSKVTSWKTLGVWKRSWRSGSWTAWVWVKCFIPLGTVWFILFFIFYFFFSPNSSKPDLCRELNITNDNGYLAFSLVQIKEEPVVEELDHNTRLALTAEDIKSEAKAHEVGTGELNNWTVL